MIKVSKIQSVGLLMGSFIIAMIILSTIVFGVKEFGVITNTDTNNNDESPGTIDEMKQNILIEIDLLIDKIQNSSDNCWWEPVSQRKEELNSKLIDIKDLIILDALNDSYNKFLHEIKPKLTGLQTDENEESWGCGMFNSWVLCDELKEEFGIDCNNILSQIKNLITITNLI